MPTPFAPFANARIAWQRPTEPLTSLRDGVRPVATETVVIEAYLEPPGGASSTASPLAWGPTTAQGGQGRSLSGYITRWAALGDGDDWLDAGAGWTWDDSGLRPTGMRAGQREHKAALVSIGDLPALERAEIGTIVLHTVGSPYGPGSVGGQITAQAGEFIAGEFRFP